MNRLVSSPHLFFCSLCENPVQLPLPHGHGSEEAVWERISY
jgi:hypothetical protein